MPIPPLLGFLAPFLFLFLSLRLNASSVCKSCPEDSPLGIFQPSLLPSPFLVVPLLAQLVPFQPIYPCPCGRVGVEPNSHVPCTHTPPSSSPILLPLQPLIGSRSPKTPPYPLPSLPSSFLPSLHSFLLYSSSAPPPASSPSADPGALAISSLMVFKNLSTCSGSF